MVEPYLSFVSRETRASKRSFFKGLSRYLRISIGFILLVGLSGIGAIMIKSFLEKKTETLTQQIQELNTKRSRALERDILQFPLQVGTVSDKFKEHLYGSKIFTFLRENTMQDVLIISVGFNNDTRFLDFDAAAGSFETLAQQVVLLRSKKEVEEVKLSPIKLLDDGKVGFSIKAILAKSFLASTK